MSICSYSATRSEPRFPSRNSKSSARRGKRHADQIEKTRLAKVEKALEILSLGVALISQMILLRNLSDALIDQFCENRIM